MSTPLAEEMKRTTVLRSVVLALPPRDILALGKRFFVEHGYRALPAGTPNALMVRGGREGVLPSVIGEISVLEKQTVRGRTSVVNLSAYGERLGPCMNAFYDLLRAERQRTRAGGVAADETMADEGQDG
jgi:hypothetical protein